jgi:transcriptional regulator GlxA family with amidase domain
MELLLLVKKKIRWLAPNIHSPPVDRARGPTTDWYYSKEMQRRYPKIAAHHHRAGGQSQFSTLLDLDAESDRISAALAYAKEHLSAPFGQPPQTIQRTVNALVQ